MRRWRLDDDVEGRDWSIRFAATETSKLLIFKHLTHSMFIPEHEEALTEHPGKRD